MDKESKTNKTDDNGAPEPSKEKLSNSNTSINSAKSESLVKLIKLNDQSKTKKSDEGPSKKTLSIRETPVDSTKSLSDFIKLKSNTMKSDEDKKSLANSELSKETLITAYRYSTTHSQSSSLFVGQQESDIINTNNYILETNRSIDFDSAESSKTSEFNYLIPHINDYDSQKAIAAFEDQAIPYRRKRKEGLIVADQPNIEDYELDCGERHYYKDCQFHFPKAVGSHRRFRENAMEYTLVGWRDYLFISLSCVGYLMFVGLFNVILFDHLTDSFNMTRPIVLMEQPYFSLAPIGSEKNYRFLHYNPEDKLEVKDYNLRIRKFLRKLSKRQPYYERFGPCQMSNKSFGYETNEPCVFLKINRLIGFVTEPFDDPLKIERTYFHRNDYELIKKLLLTFPPEERENRIWITCFSGDKAKIDIFPEPFIRTKYVDKKRFRDIEVHNEKITFQSTTDLNRVVALKISNMRLMKKYKFKCKMWANNIIRNQEGYGKIYFYVKVDRLKPHQQVSQESPNLP